MNQWSRRHGWGVSAVCVVLLAACSDVVPTVPRMDASASGSGPAASAADPNNAPQDTTLDVVVSGTGFDRGSTAEWAIGGVPSSKVHTNSTRFISPKQLIANITIAIDAETVLYDVLVTTGGGKKGIGTELFTVRPKGPKPQEPANPEIAYVDNGALKVMNASGSNQTAVFTGTVEPAWPAWAPGGSSIALDYQGAYHLWRVDVSLVDGVPTGLSPQELVDTTTGFPDWSPSGTSIVVHGSAAGRPGENCCLITIDAAGGSPSVVYVARVGRTVMFPQWSPDGGEIAFLERSTSCGANPSCDGELRILTLSTGATRTLVPSGLVYDWPTDLDWSPDGQEIAFASRTRRTSPATIHLVAVSTGVVTNLGVAGRSPSFSPDGRRLVFENLKAAGIYVLDRNTGATTQLSSGGRFPDWRRP